jgi:hypothetical protein
MRTLPRLTADGKIQHMELALETGMALSGLPLGSPRSKVTGFFGREPRPFKRTETCNESDYWPDLGVFAYYDDAANLEALEFAEPANPAVLGHVLTDISLQEAQQLLRRLDRDVEIEADGAISKKLGIGIWSEAGMDGPVQAVIRFRDGYLD